MLTFLPLIRDDLGITVAQAGLGASIFFLVYAFGQISGGMLADKIGPKKVMGIAIVVFSCVTFVTGIIQSFTQFILARIFLAVGESHHFSPAQRTIADWFPKSEKGFATSFFATAWSIGPAIIPVIATSLAMALGGWRPVFYVLAIPGVIGIFILVRYVYNSPDDALIKGKLTQSEYDYIKAGLIDVEKGSEKIGFSVVARDKYFWIYAGSLFCCQSTYWGCTTWLSSFLLDQHHFSLSQMGALVSLPYVVAIIAMIVGGRLVDKVFKSRVKPVMLISFIASIPILVYTGMAPSDNRIIVVILILLGFFVNLVWGAIYSYPQVRYPKDCVGSAVGVSNCIGYIGSFLSPLVAGYLVVKTADGYNYSGAFIMFGVVSVAGAIFTALLNERKYDYKKVSVK